MVEVGTDRVLATPAPVLRQPTGGPSAPRCRREGGTVFPSARQSLAVKTRRPPDWSVLPSCSGKAVNVPEATPPHPKIFQPLQSLQVRACSRHRVPSTSPISEPASQTRRVGGSRGSNAGDPAAQELKKTDGAGRRSPHPSDVSTSESQAAPNRSPGGEPGP